MATRRPPVDASPLPPAVDPMTIRPRTGSRYPEPHRARVNAERRRRRALGDALGLTHYGVNLVHLPPGSMSSLRHWHSRQDELVYVVAGELTLVTNGGAQTLRAGMAAGFPAGVPDAHHLVNRGGQVAVYLEIGDRAAGDEVDYADVDMRVQWIDGRPAYVHKDGTLY